MTKNDSVKQIYYHTLPNGEIKFVDDYVPFLTYLFALAGYNIKNIKTPGAFEYAFESAAPFFDKAAQHQIAKLNNKYYNRAFKKLAEGDMTNFVEDCQKGNRLSQLRKNTLTNK